jgi:hypothetical protein
VAQGGLLFQRRCLGLLKLKRTVNLEWLEQNIIVQNVEYIMVMYLMTGLVLQEKDFVTMVFA